jgi:putative acetyltransferase
MEIRAERPRDVAQIRLLNIAAFNREAEANLVDLLRTDAHPTISLVADVGGEIAGHILFSPVTVSARPELLVMGLAPMGVIPQKQRQGIGSALVERGVDECRRLGAAALVVLGHPGFYPRFGFAPASRFGLRSEYDVPEDVFMAMELAEGVLTAAPGLVTYHPAFATV